MRRDLEGIGVAAAIGQRKEYDELDHISIVGAVASGAEVRVV